MSIFKRSEDRFQIPEGIVSSCTEKDFLSEIDRLIKTVCDTIPDGAIMADAVTKRIVAVNEKMCQMLGYDRNELKKLNLPDIYNKENSSFLSRRPKSSCSHDVNLTKQMSLRRKDGGFLFADVYSRLMSCFGKDYILEIFRHVETSGKIEQTMKRLSSSTTELVQFAPEQDLYEFVCRNVKELIGPGIVSVNRIHGDELKIMTLLGMDERQNRKVKRILKFPLPGVTLRGVTENVKNTLMTGTMVKVPGGLEEAFFYNVPDRECRQLRQLLGIREVFSAGLRQADKLFGNVTVIAVEGTNVDVYAIETLVNQASTVLEHRHAQQELRESERRFKSIFDNANDVIASVDKTGKILEVNKKVKEMLGYEPHEVVGRNFASLGLLRPQNLPTVVKMFKESVAKGKVINPKGDKSVLQFQLKHKKGHNVYVEINTTAVKRDGKLQGFLSIIRDISERKNSEMELRCSEEKYRTVFENTGTATCIIENDGTISLANKKFSQLAGYPLEEIQNKKSWMEFIQQHDPGRIQIRHNLIRRDRNRPRKSYELGFVDKKGNLKNVLLTMDMIPNTDKTVVSLLDITERKRAEEQLGLLSRAVQQSTEGIAVSDLQGNLLFANHAFAAMHGYTSDELIGKHLSVFHSPEQMEAVKAANRQILEKGAFSGELMHVRSDGTVFPTLMHNSLLKDEKGDPLAMMAAVLDITERKRAKESEKESARFSTDLLTNAPTPIVVINPDASIRYANPALEKLTGFNSREILAAKPPYPWWVEKNIEETEKIFRTAMSEGLNRRELVFKKKNGQRFWVEITSKPVKEGNKLKYYLASWLDVTERKYARQKLQNSEKKYRIVSENVPVAVYSALPDENSTNLFISGRMKELTGYSEKQFLEDPKLFNKILHPDDKDRVWKEIYEHRRNNNILDVEYRIITKDNVLKWIRGKATPLLDENGRITRINGFMEDVTERRKTMEKNMAYQAQLKKLSSQLELAEQRERRRLAQGLHDDVGQKLALAKLSLQTLQSQWRTKKSDDSSIKNICDILDEIILHTRSLTFELGNPLLYQVGLDAAIEQWMAENLEKKHHLNYKFRTSHRPVKLDNNVSVVIFQIARELLVNVLKHANATEVSVAIHQFQSSLSIKIEDNGCGFHPEQLHSPSPEETSQKFGLFNVRERIDYLGGNFKIESGTGTGTRVTLTVPVKSDNIKE